MSDRTSAWPELPVAQWVDTRDTLQLMTQVVGKVRLANTPLVNHWWNVVLYVSARGLTTGLIPYADKGFSIDFDFIDHQLVVSTTGGDRRTVALRAGPIADFHREVVGVLDELGLSTEIWTTPVEIEGAIPFDTDQQHIAYDGDQVHRFWLALVQMNRVFEVFRSRFIGKVSPVHFFWAHSIWRSPGSPDAPRPNIRAARRTAAPTSCGRPTPTKSARGILAGPGRRRRLLLLCLPRASRVSGRVHLTGPGVIRRRSGRIHAAVHRRTRGRRPRRRAARVPAEHLRRRRRTGNWDRAALERGQ